MRSREGEKEIGQPVFSADYFLGGIEGTVETSN
jgi:hypothetical protein